MQNSQPSNRPFHRGTCLGSVFPTCLDRYLHIAVSDVVAGIADDRLTGMILSGTLDERVRYLRCVYDELFYDVSTRATFDVIAKHPTLFGKVISKSDAARAIVCNILLGVRAGVEVTNNGF